MYRRRYVISFVVISTLVLFLGITSDVRFGIVTSKHDKISHFVVFCVETFLFVRIFVDKYLMVDLFVPARVRTRFLLDFDEPISISKYWVAFGVCCIGASISSELVQQLASRGKRAFDLLDIVCNFGGSLMGLGAAYVRER